MKIAFIFGAWAMGPRPLDFNCLWSSSRGLTGSDLGFARTASIMVKLGHDVSLFCTHMPNKPNIWEGVKLYSHEDIPVIITQDFDAIITWSDPNVLRELPTKPLKVVCQMLNDFIYCHEGFDDYVDIWTAPCQMLIDHLLKSSNSPPKHKFHVVPLGCEPSWYTDQRVPGRVVWTSSADRGLHLLLQEWPKIKTAVPYADLRIFYDFNYSGIDSLEPHVTDVHPHTLEMGHRARHMKEAIKRLKHYGVLLIGSVSRDRMRQEMSMASVLAYPCDTLAFSEGFSVSILEAHASYTVPVITDTDCLGSIYEHSGSIVIKDIKHNINSFTDAVIKSLTDKPFADDVIEKCRSFADDYTWTKSAQKLEVLIKENIKR